MVDLFQPSVLRFLLLVHRAPRAVGVEELAREDNVPDARTLYRWQRQLADDLIYYPSVSFGALGLTHLHLFIDDPTPGWEDFPYAVAADWVAGRPGQHALYLHCVVPEEHLGQVLEVLDELQGQNTCRQITAIGSHDGWQVLGDLTSEESPPELVPEAVLRAQGKAVWDVVERVPLLIPIIFESVEARRSFPAIWDEIHGRLGDRAWQYLPRGARRLPTNGKTYVKDAYALLNHTGLFRQNVVRYRPLGAIGTTMFLRVTGEDVRTVVTAFVRRATALDIYPVGDTEALLRVVATHASTQWIMSGTAGLPRVTDWYFVDALRPAPHVRFAYELLFDPSTTEWRFPREAITQRVTR